MAGTSRAEAGVSVVDVLVETGTYEGGWKFANVAEVEAETNEQLFRVARHVWDEADTGLQGSTRRLTFAREVVRDEDGTVSCDGVIYRTEVRP